MPTTIRPRSRCPSMANGVRSSAPAAALPETASCLESLGRSTFTPIPNHATPDPSTFGRTDRWRPAAPHLASGRTRNHWGWRFGTRGTTVLRLGASSWAQAVADAAHWPCRRWGLSLQLAFKLCDRAHAGIHGRLGLRRMAPRVGAPAICWSEKVRASGPIILVPGTQPQAPSAGTGLRQFLSKTGTEPSILGEVPNLQETPIPLAPSLDRFCRPSIILEDIKILRPV